MTQLTETINREHLHGGKVHEAARRWGVNPEAVVDFSANINPFGPPPAVLEAISAASSGVNLKSYPDTSCFTNVIAQRYELSPESVVVGNGVAGLLFASVRALAPRRVCLLQPAFGEYQRACDAAGAEVVNFDLGKDFLPDSEILAKAIEARKFELIVINNPHNPSGALYPKDQLLTLLKVAVARGLNVAIDEAFIDYVPDESLRSFAATSNHLIVFQSLTKFYSIPGLRVGYAICGAELSRRIRAQLDPWPVSTVALEAGCAALTQVTFEEQSRRLNLELREEFSAALAALGLKVFPSATNFLLVELPDSWVRDLENWLERAKVLVRRCESFAGLDDRHIRLAVKSREDNVYLVGLIKQWLEARSVWQCSTM